MSNASENFDDGPIFIPGALYSASYVLSRCGIAKKTLRRWEQAGLRGRKPGTTQKFYFGDDLMAVFRMNDDDIPPYRPEYLDPDED
jgi:hypothetical protein